MTVCVCVCVRERETEREREREAAVEGLEQCEDRMGEEMEKGKRDVHTLSSELSTSLPRCQDPHGIPASCCVPPLAAVHTCSMPRSCRSGKPANQGSDFSHAHCKLCHLLHLHLAHPDHADLVGLQTSDIRAKSTENSATHCSYI